MDQTPRSADLSAMEDDLDDADESEFYAGWLRGTTDFDFES